jgi:DNA repair exonuclease SbcCD ATPase subunit
LQGELAEAHAQRQQLESQLTALQQQLEQQQQQQWAEASSAASSAVDAGEGGSLLGSRSPALPATPTAAAISNPVFCPDREVAELHQQLEALQEQLVAAEQARLALQQEVDQLRSLGVQQELALTAAASPRDVSPLPAGQGGSQELRRLQEEQGQLQQQLSAVQAAAAEAASGRQAAVEQLESELHHLRQQLDDKSAEVALLHEEHQRQQQLLADSQAEADRLAEQLAAAQAAAAEGQAAGEQAAHHLRQQAEDKAAEALLLHEQLRQLQQASSGVGVRV